MIFFLIPETYYDNEYPSMDFNILEMLGLLFLVGLGFLFHLLVYEDTYGQGAHWVRDNKPTGNIYRCPNSGGFSEEAEAINYLLFISKKRDECIKSIMYADKNVQQRHPG